MTSIEVSLATKHGKLAQIAPVFEEVLGWQLLLAEIDTDEFGSFDGSVPRALSPRDTVLAKARAGAQFLGTRFGLASEGTIGYHPSYPLTTSDHELIAFVDLEFETELVVSHVSPKIVAEKLEVFDLVGLPDLMAKFDLPNHAVTLRAEVGGEILVTKGLTSPIEVIRILEHAISNPGFEKAALESDFRAMCSPSRQRNIEHCAALAANRLAESCPRCNYLGWGLKRFEFGLECRVCGFENHHLANSEVLGCLRCEHESTQKLGRSLAEPANCLSCNP